MTLMDIFDNENKLLMFYHTVLRNIISLTALAFVALAFADKIRNKTYFMFGELLALIIICSAIYLNYTLIKIFYVNKYKSYKYIDEYHKINLFMIIIHCILLITIIIKIKKVLF